MTSIPEQLQKDLAPEKSMDILGLQEFTRCMRSPWRVIWTNFLAGFFRSFGWIIGLVLAISLSFFILSQYVDFSFVDKYLSEMNQLINKAQQLQSSQKIPGSM